MFLWPYPSGRPAWPLASTVLCGVRTFLALKMLRARPPDLLGCHFHINTKPLRCQVLQRGIVINGGQVCLVADDRCYFLNPDATPWSQRSEMAGRALSPRPAEP